jgi:hypothetical protein
MPSPVLRSAVIVLAAWALTAPPAAAAGRVIRLAPNGVDDTVALQDALDRCAAAAPPCRIDLAAGTFHSDVLLVHGFRGAIRGAGRGRTILEPVAGRALRSTPDPFVRDPTPAQPWPVFLHFAGGGDITLTGFTLRFPAGMRVTPYVVGEPVEDALLSAIMVDGTGHARLEVRHVEVLGARHDRPSSFGSNVMNAIRFEGQIRIVEGASIATPLAAGEFVAHDTVLRDTGLGFALRDVTRVNAVIANNIVSGARLIGVFLTDMGDSHVLVADNDVRSELIGLQILRGFRAPTQPSSFDVVGNRITVDGAQSLFGPGDGVIVADLTPEGAINRVHVRRNRIHVANGVFDAVYVYGDRRKVLVARNVLSGQALDAGITVAESEGTRTFHNDFSQFDGGVADVWLLPSSRRCRVTEPGAVVVDETGELG